MKVEAKLSFRALWYSVVIWLLAIVISGFVIVPWFYIVMTAAVSLLTIYYFKLIVPLKIKRGRKKMAERDRVFIFGLVKPVSCLGGSFPVAYCDSSPGNKLVAPPLG